jgi:hypothetical protein
MKRRDQERLWDAVFAEQNVDELRAASLAAGLGVLRQRKRRRALVSAVAAAFALMLTAAAILERASRRPRAPAPAAAAPARSTPVVMIGDDELLALFPGRPAALIGPPGAQVLVFLDRRGADFGASNAP